MHLIRKAVYGQIKVLCESDYQIHFVKKNELLILVFNNGLISIAEYRLAFSPLTNPKLTLESILFLDKCFIKFVPLPTSTIYLCPVSIAHFIAASP